MFPLSSCRGSTALGMEMKPDDTLCGGGMANLQPGDSTGGGGQAGLQQVLRTAAVNCPGEMTAATADAATQTDSHPESVWGEERRKGRRWRSVEES